MRRVHRADLNQAEIVAELRQIPGLTVEIMGRPVDLLIGYRGRTYLVDVKNREGRDRLTPAQKEFIDGWTGGPVLLAHTFEDVWELVSRET